MTPKLSIFGLLLVLSGCCLDVITGTRDSGGESSGTAGINAASTSTGGSASATSTGTGSGGSPTTGGASTGTSGIAVGPCTSSSQCASGICGLDGSGNCCTATCPKTAAPCGATDCNVETGACDFPTVGTECGSPLCNGNLLSGPRNCDGAGNCSTVEPAPCGVNEFCDPQSAACCETAASVINVDSVLGSDGPCCGVAGTPEPPCRTLTRAMELINASRESKLIIVATVDGGGGDWGTDETYPVVLGHDVVLKAPNVYFNDLGGNPELLDIAAAAPGDEGSATLTGNAGEDVWLGISRAGVHSTDPATVKVESGGTLALIGVKVASSMSSQTTALVLVGDATLNLGGTDGNGGPAFGPVTIGTDSQGWNGIVCVPVDGGGCQVATLGNSSIAIQGQQNLDIDAEDDSSMNFGPNNITIGFAAVVDAFGGCPTKPDTGSSHGPAILLHGSAAMSFAGIVQCIDGTGIELQASPNGSPSLSLEGSTILNTDIGIHAQAGTAEIHGSLILFNAIGVWQDQDAWIDLTGSGFSDAGCLSQKVSNTVVCNFGKEIGQDGGGVSVRNTGSRPLPACGVLWDTAGPDLFRCDSAFNNCTCEAASCTEAGGSAENMDAVYTDDAGPILTAGGQLSSLNCGPP